LSILIWICYISRYPCQLWCALGLRWGVLFFGWKVGVALNPHVSSELVVRFAAVINPHLKALFWLKGCCSVKPSLLLGVGWKVATVLNPHLKALSWLKGCRSNKSSLLLGVGWKVCYIIKTSLEKRTVLFFGWKVAVVLNPHFSFWGWLTGDNSIKSSLKTSVPHLCRKIVANPQFVCELENHK
jgi:hypothetical protein